jgi:hypothetical protein
MLRGIRCGVVGNRSYPAGAESSWFGAEHEREHYGEEGYRGRGPAHRGAGPVGPRPGQSLPPPLLPGDPAAHPLAGAPGAPTGLDEPSQHLETGHHLEALERTTVRRGHAAAQVGDGIYRTRRPAVAVPLGIATVLLALPAGRMLLAAAFGPVLLPGGVIAGVMALIGLPLVAVGLYALLTGAARAPDPSGARVWLRPPLAYLLIGLTCCVAAGLAAS